MSEIQRQLDYNQAERDWAYMKITDLESQLAAAKAEIDRLNDWIGNDCSDKVTRHLESENKRLREEIERWKLDVIISHKCPLCGVLEGAVHLKDCLFIENKRLCEALKLSKFNLSALLKEADKSREALEFIVKHKEIAGWDQNPTATLYGIAQAALDGGKA